MSVKAIIPARGGSKGIPRKNLVEICGRPLVVHSIDHALAAPEVDEVLVSTDDREIAAVSRHGGATVIDRPAELSDDFASSETALLHALDFLGARDGREPELIVFLQATSPLRPPGAISDAIRLLQAQGADSLFSAADLEGFVWRVRGTAPEPLNYDPRRRPRRQDCDRHVFENGSIYVFKPHVLRSWGSRLGGRIAVLMQDPLYSFQVDEPDDIQVIKGLFQAVRSVEAARPSATVPEPGD